MLLIFQVSFHSRSSRFTIVLCQPLSRDQVEDIEVFIFLYVLPSYYNAEKLIENKKVAPVI